MTERQKAYQEFLQSEFWKTIRQQCKDRANRRCEDCKAHGVRFHAHHTSYPEDWYKTTLEQLRCLCDKCHRKAHGLPVPALTAKQARKRAKKEAKRRRQLDVWIAKKQRLAAQNRRLIPATGFTGTIFNGSIEEHDHRFSRSRMIERAC